jgi:hypothetical protein
MEKKRNRVLKLSKETLRALNEHVLGEARGGATVACTAKCESGTICSCPETEISCWDTCGAQYTCGAYC